MRRFGALVMVDTITKSGKPKLLLADAAFPESFACVGVHSPTDIRAAGDRRMSTPVRRCAVEDSASRLPAD